MKRNPPTLAARASQAILAVLLIATILGAFHIHELSFQLQASVGTAPQPAETVTLANTLQQRSHWLSLGLAALGLWLIGFTLANYLRSGRIDPGALIGASDADLTLNALPNAVIRFSLDGRLIELNPAAERLLGVSLADARDQKLDQILEIIDHDSRSPILSGLMHELLQGNPAALNEQACLVTQEGMELEVEGQAAPILSARGQAKEAVLVIRDVTEAREQQRKQAWLARHDALTGALNRKAFEDRLARVINSKRASEYPMTLLVIGIDSHTAVLQREGQSAANELLIQIARLIQNRLRDTDTVGRLDDTHFGVTLAACPDDIAQRIARTLHESLSRHKLEWGKADYLVNISMGLVHIPRNWEMLDRVMTAGQAACAQSRATRDIAVHMN